MTTSCRNRRLSGSRACCSSAACTLGPGSMARQDERRPEPAAERGCCRGGADRRESEACDHDDHEIDEGAAFHQSELRNSGCPAGTSIF